MDSIKAKHFGQDLQDHLDIRAFGLKVSRREKNPINPVKEKETKDRILSTLSVLMWKK